MCSACTACMTNHIEVYTYSYPLIIALQHSTLERKTEEKTNNKPFASFTPWLQTCARHVTDEASNFNQTQTQVSCQPGAGVGVVVGAANMACSRLIWLLYSHLWVVALCGISWNANIYFDGVCSALELSKLLIKLQNDSALMSSCPGQDIWLGTLFFLASRQYY